MREPLTPPLMRSNVFTHIGRKVQAPRPSLSLAGSTCTSIHEVELGQCSRFAKRPFAKGPFGKRTAFCAAAVSARQPKAQNAYSPNQPRTGGHVAAPFVPMACLVVLPNARRASDRFVHCVLGVKWGGGHVAAPFVPMVVALVLNFLCTQYYSLREGG